MHSETPPRQQLIQAIADLSDRQVTLLLQWVEALQTPSVISSSDSSIDPLADFIGANTHGQLASTLCEAQLPLLQALQSPSD